MQYSIKIVKLKRGFYTFFLMDKTNKILGKRYHRSKEKLMDFLAREVDQIEVD